MEYNTQQEKLILPGYGRNVQHMIEYAMTIEDVQERQHCAETIIRVMASKFPKLKGTEGFEHKLWDHMALISGYKLDVVSPYPINIMENEEEQTPHLDYPTNKFYYRHYGATLERMARSLPSIEDEQTRQEALELVAGQMARSLFLWNPNVLTAEKIVNDLAELTEGKIEIFIAKDRMDALLKIAHQQPKPTTKKKRRR